MMANLTVPYRVTLGDLFPGALQPALSGALELRGLDTNSASIEPGDLFLACPGTVHDGRRYIDDAIGRGAVAVAYESRGAEAVLPRRDCVDVQRDAAVRIPVDNLAPQVGAIGARYFRDPSQALTCIGVTGTNGKTSCAFWIAHALATLGAPSGLIGTLGHQFVARDRASPLQATGMTTPDALRVQHVLAGFRDSGATHAVMEVSSHSLVQARVDAVRFRTALFTNLTRDHLDYHGTMEAYGAAKARLLAFDSLQHAIVNLDDAFGRTLAGTARRARTISYGVQAGDADVRVVDLDLTLHGARGTLVTPWGHTAFAAPVAGAFNVANLLGVVATLGAEGFALADIAAALAALPAVPGRLQRIGDAADDIAVFVDFAHTPDALDQVLTTLRAQTPGALWCVFGCGGDRDAGKRPLMGEVASRRADYLVVTSDNPRAESPQAIIAAIVAATSPRAEVVVDRRDAIRHAIAAAAPGDVVVIAGKGHEDYQEIEGAKVPFSDAHEARQALQMRRAGRESCA